jgi:hypothetical protein
MGPSVKVFVPWHSEGKVSHIFLKCCNMKLCHLVRQETILVL